MAIIPEHIIDRIRQSVSIVEVISRYVTLKKRGRNFVGLCPFHQEKTPSFSVNPEKQIFHCFGCGTGGNVFRFLMQHEKLGFVDAVKRLAEETGIEIPRSEAMQKQLSENERLLKANSLCEKFYQKCLENAPPAIMEYVNRRGITSECLAEFRIGYARDGWDHLLKYLQNMKQNPATYKSLGLLLTSEKTGKLYDRFRDRLMFPIHDPAGKVVGFGGRAMKDDPRSPKYINSPESPVYQKSRILYGLYFARTAIREGDAVIMVEGYMDVIQLHQAGIRHAVATSGTALTEAHANLIRRYSTNIVLCYDADKAGIQAALRGGQVLFQQHLEVRVLILPVGEDPDSYVQKHGPEAFLKLLDSADDYLAFRLKILGETYNINNAAERSAAAGELLEVLLPMQDNIRVSYYVEKLAETLGVKTTMLMGELKKRRKTWLQRKQFSDMRQRSEAANDHAAEGPAVDSGPLVFTGAWGGEKDIVLLLTQYYNDIHEYVAAHLESADFLNPEFRELFEFVGSRDFGGSDEVLHAVLEKIEHPRLRSMLLREMEHTNREFERPAEYLQGCIKQIKIARYQADLDVSRRKMRELKPGDNEYQDVLKLMQQAMSELKRWKDVEIS